MAPSLCQTRVLTGTKGQASAFSCTWGAAGGCKQMAGQAPEGLTNLEAVLSMLC